MTATAVASMVRASPLDVAWRGVRNIHLSKTNLILLFFLAGVIAVYERPLSPAMIEVNAMQGLVPPYVPGRGDARHSSKNRTVLEEGGW